MANDLKNVRPVQRVFVGRDGLRRFEQEWCLEDREPTKHGLLSVVEEVVAPGDRGQQCLLACHPGSGATGQDTEHMREFGDNTVQ